MIGLIRNPYDRCWEGMMWTVKRLNGIKSICVNSLSCVRVKEIESDCFRIDSDVRQGCTLFPYFFNVYKDAVMKEVKMGMGRMGVDAWRRGESGDFLAFVCI